MRKSELLEYLNAVCDAENALYNCKQTKEAYEMEKDKIPHPTAPKKPEQIIYTDAPGEETNVISALASTIGFVLAAVARALVLIVSFILFVSLLQRIWEVHWGLFVGTLLSIGALALTFCFEMRDFFTDFTADLLCKIGSKKRLRILNEEAERHYRQDTQTYNKQYAEYEKARKIENTAITTLTDAIKEQDNYILSFEQYLKRLYSRNIIVVEFQNIIAVNHIKRYLEIGICDTLTGANGAYAQYMNDVRTQRIITSINNMKDQLLSSLDNIATNQMTLFREIRATNENIRFLQTSFSDFSYQLSEYQRSASQQLSTASNHLAKANDLLTDIKNTAKTSAHNQYVVAKQANINSYLLRRP